MGNKKRPSASARSLNPSQTNNTRLQKSSDRVAGTKTSLRNVGPDTNQPWVRADPQADNRSTFPARDSQPINVPGEKLTWRLRKAEPAPPPKISFPPRRTSAAGTFITRGGRG